MQRWVKRHVEFCEARAVPYATHNDRIFRLYGRAVRPHGPSRLDYTLSSEDARHLLARLAGSLIQCSGGFTHGETSPWYAVICDEFTPLCELKAKQRSEVRRGLRMCEVRRVDARWLAQHGYEVFWRAFERYSGRAKASWTEEEFHEYLRHAELFDDIVHCWAAFCEGRLAAFGVNDIFDRIEATYWSIKLHPDYLKAYPAYALIHTMNEYYLHEQGFEYVNDGWRSLLHGSQIQNFLIRKFRFRRAPSRLQVFYTPVVGLAVRATYPLRHAIGGLDRRLKAVYALENFRRACARSVRLSHAGEWVV